MSREDVIRELAMVARRSHAASLAGLGWLALELPTGDLEALLEVMQETQRAWEPGRHLEVYAERWGTNPAPRP